MIYRELGRSSIRVSAIGQGTMGIGGEFSPDRRRDAESIARLRQGVDLGMTLIDTAEVYGGGHTEELVGKAIRGMRDMVVLASKFSSEHNSAPEVIKSLEGSLRRLGTEWIDLYQVHWPNPAIPMEETAEALRRLLADGKIRSVGVSNFSVGELDAMRQLFPDGRLLSIQNEYNLLERSAESTLLPYCREHGITFMAYSPLNHGKLREGDPGVALLDEIASRHGATVSQVALRWLVQDQTVVAIPKAGSPDHVEQNAKSAELTLSSSEYERISEAFRPQIEQIATTDVEVNVESGRKVYLNLQEAIENRFQLSPSPAEIAEQMVAGDILKPIKLLRLPPDQVETRPYLLLEGRLRYWAWIIAFGWETPIPALIERQ